MKRVQAQLGVPATISDDGRDPLGRIGADQRDLGAALHTEGVEELLQRRAVPARTGPQPVSYTHLRAHETPEHLVCRLLLEKKKKKNQNTQKKQKRKNKKNTKQKTKKRK